MYQILIVEVLNSQRGLIKESESQIFWESLFMIYKVEETTVGSEF